ncbi:MAG: nucleotide exchange factor GrpE [Nanoarchaeota archaeon]
MDKNKTKDDAKTKEEAEKPQEYTEVELLKNKIEELENQNKRILADYRNLERRVDSQRRDWILEANKKLLLNLLPVLDTLVLAEQHIKVGDEGLSLGIKQFRDLLRNENVERIATLGKNFDPRLMECIDTAEGEEDSVLKEFRAGYTLHGQMLRTAQVQIGKKRKEKEAEEKAKKE